jgi:hypothetical protein
MVDEIKKLVVFIVSLSIIGSFVGFSIINPNIINFILSAITLGWAMIIISVFLLLLFVIIIATISIPISKIGVYYKAKPFHGWREPIFTNAVEVFLNYLILTIPLYITIMYLLNNANFFVTSGTPVDTTDIINEFKITLVIIPGYLLSIRLLSTPMQKKSRIPIANLILDVVKKYYPDEKSTAILKERVISFYFSLTSSTFFIMVMLWIYKTIPLTSQASLSEPLNLSFWGMVITGFQVTFIPNFDPNGIVNVITIIWFLGAYIFSLFLLTFFGEIVINHYIPISPENKNPELSLKICGMLNECWLFHGK